MAVTPKWHFLARKHVVWAIKRENRSNGSTWVRHREKGTGQLSQSKKSQRRYISPTLREVPTEPICTENCTVLAVADVITCANVWTEFYRGYDFTGFYRFIIFLLILAWALQQCSANALPMISLHALPCETALIAFCKWTAFGTVNRKNTPKWYCHMVYKTRPIETTFSTYCPEYICHQVVLSTSPE